MADISAATLAEERVVEKYASLDEKIFMTLEESMALGSELARRLSSLNSPPQVVVGVADGAILVADVVGHRLNIPVQLIRIQRRGSRVKQALSGVPGLRSAVSLWYRIPILRVPLVWAMHRFEALKKEDRGRGTPPEVPPVAGKVAGRVVALVDDCIETGQTVAAARDRLVQAGARCVIVACISWSARKDSTAAHGVQPDIFITRRIQHYPWSANSPHWKAFQEWLAKRERNRSAS